ncbi:hypothetical protein [Streptomyces sp. ST1015]|uniref:hypothetical protein n=1 Tax=Streptomyces sp. ST1015 TaxID=1848900 RepID=UPI00223B5657|nr:hypothetical protein [Streptomyces sp. ST1015]
MGRGPGGPRRHGRGGTARRGLQRLRGTGRLQCPGQFQRLEQPRWLRLWLWLRLSRRQQPRLGQPRHPQGPTPPATPAQLVAGITFAQAADGLEKCLAFDRSGVQHPGEEGLGEASEYRIILAIPSTGDSNSPGDGIYVVAVKEKPTPVRLICTLKNGRAEGINSSGGAEEFVPLVYPDINSGKLYQQSFIDRGNWKLPFRWGVIGTYVPAKVTRVTASYGTSTPVEATLDHGWYVATGVLDRQVTRAPHLKGYDSSGRLVYDSDTDTTYERVLP